MGRGAIWGSVPETLKSKENDATSPGKSLELIELTEIAFDLKICSIWVERHLGIGPETSCEMMKLSEIGLK